MIEDSRTIFKLAEEFFHKSTGSLYDTPQYNYLRKLGYDPETIESLNPGYIGETPDDFLNYLYKHDVSEEMVLLLGLDEVANKIIFTKYDHDHNPIGFSCRTMDEKTFPRYKHISPFSNPDQTKLVA